mgnify:CR=1 FL=1
MYMLGRSYVSLAGAVLLLIVAVTFVPSKVSRKKRLMIGVLHVSAHLAAALILMLLLELGVEMCIQHKLLGTSGELYILCYFLSLSVVFVHLITFNYPIIVTIMKIMFLDLVFVLYDVIFTFQAIILYISGTDRWRVSTFQIQLAFELV